MAVKVVCCFFAVVMVSMVTAQTQNQQEMSQCQTTFLQSLNTCFQKNQLVFNNFLWIVSNGTNGQAHNDPDGLRENICKKQKELVKCGVKFMRTLINATMCAPSQSSQADQRPMLDRQFRTLFGTLDDMCAHPCRHTLAEELRQCYVDADLDPKLFLSNSTMGRGAVIGTTSKQADDFCTHKDALISCMKQRSNDCPESPIILRAIGLDIESMEKGVNVLCAHRDLYLTGIDCFAEPTEDVLDCQQTMNRDTVELMMTSQQQKLSEDQFFNHFCDIRLEHVKCDLESWSKKNHKACSEGVLGLRTELECGLLPDNCANTHQQMIEQVCHDENFKRAMRANGVSTVVFSWFVLSPLVVISILMSVYKETKLSSVLLC